MSETLTKPVKIHGGKDYLADWIISLMPPRCKYPNKPDQLDKGWLHFVEPYFGGGSVLLANDPEGISEVVCDINKDLTTFWHVLRDRDAFENFYRIIQATPFSEIEYRYPWPSCADVAVERAVAFFVRNRQSLSGRMTDFASITRNRTRRGMNEQVSAWLGAVDGLPAVHARMSRVLILAGPALKVIKKEDGPRTLFYLDPPYLKSTRTAKKVYGQFEMSKMDHLNLLVTLGGVKAARALACYVRGEIPKWWSKAKPIKGRFLLSGYPSAIYQCAAAACGWKCHERKIDNKASNGKTKRVMTECVWTNY